MGKWLIILGVVCIISGLLYSYSNKIPLPGKLPGDIVIEKENFRLYFPVTTSILIIILLSLILYLINRWKN